MWTLLHGGALGDLVLTLHLALRLPNADQGVQVISRVNPGDLAACRPSFHHISPERVQLHQLFTPDEPDQPNAPTSEPLRAALGSRPILNLLSGPDDPLHERLRALAPRTVYSVAPRTVYSVDPRPVPETARHITEQWRTQLERQGLLLPKCIHQRPSQWALGVPDALRAAGRERASRAGIANGAAYVALHPGSGGRAKCWPLENFLSVAAALKNSSLTPLWLLGPAECERWPDSAHRALRDLGPVLCCPTPNELLAILAGAHAYLGNDSGPTHLAALLGTPTIAIFGPTSALVWRPLGPNVCIFQDEPDACVSHNMPDSASKSPANWGIDAHAVAARLSLSTLNP